MSGVNDIRSAFLNYFAENDHTVVPSSPLVPRNDPTLMFTNAGIEPILQLTCRDRNRIGLQGDLMGAAALGIRNLLILTGDKPEVGDQPDAVPIAAGQLQDRLDASLLENGRRGDRAHMCARSRPVGDVDSVGDALERRCLGEQIGGRARDRRHHLGGQDKAPRGKALF